MLLQARGHIPGSDDQQDLCLRSAGLWQKKGQFVAGAAPQDSGTEKADRH